MLRQVSRKRHARRHAQLPGQSLQLRSQRPFPHDPRLKGQTRRLQCGVDVQLMLQPLFLHQPSDTQQPQRLTRRPQRLHHRQPIKPAPDAMNPVRLEPALDQRQLPHLCRGVDEGRVLQLVAQPPVAAMLVKIVGVRRRAEAMAVQPPKQPRRGRRRSTPRRMDMRRWVLPERTRIQAGKSRSEHVFPKIHPRRRPARE
ncbi:MAG: hypothetical protein BWY76_03520 [bacterium ADurb.Bin429]|nr:MAG: hypothetical protein BWY76_03520 [bacterium ADurb.Bin429]